MYSTIHLAISDPQFNWYMSTLLHLTTNVNTDLNKYLSSIMYLVGEMRLGLQSRNQAISWSLAANDYRSVTEIPRKKSR